MDITHGISAGTRVRVYLRPLNQDKGSWEFGKLMSPYFGEGAVVLENSREVIVIPADSVAYIRTDARS